MQMSRGLEVRGKYRTYVQSFFLCLFWLLFFTNAWSAPPKGKPEDNREISDCTVITQPGGYELTKNLPNGDLLPSGDCIRVESDNVYFDLNGYTISGSGVGSAVTDGGASRVNIKIEGGTVRGFANGIDLASSTGSWVAYVQAFDNLADGITLGQNSVAFHNVAIDNEQGLVLRCPSNFIGNSVWNNSSKDLVINDLDDCNFDSANNSFGTISVPETCQLPETDCSGICTETGSDPLNCGACGIECALGEECVEGLCEAVCIPECTGKTCGDDGCGGVCGICAEGEICDETGMCAAS